MSGFGIRPEDALPPPSLLGIGKAVSPVGQVDPWALRLAFAATSRLLHQGRLVQPVTVTGSLGATAPDDALQSAVELRQPTMPFRAAPLPAGAVDCGAARGATAVFRKEADYWTLRYDRRELRLRDLKGLRYLARLLTDPGHPIHVADLVAGSGVGFLEPGARTRAVADHAGERLDPKARAEYRRRLADLREQVGAAEADHDLGRLERLRAEMDFIARELCSAYGLGGRARRTADQCERMRKGVTNRIREAIARIRKEDETLALHLTNSLRLGVICVYQPERPVRWDVG
jgi:hypothetical protein